MTTTLFITSTILTIVSENVANNERKNPVNSGIPLLNLAIPFYWINGKLYPCKTLLYLAIPFYWTNGGTSQTEKKNIIDSKKKGCRKLLYLVNVKLKNTYVEKMRRKNVSYYYFRSLNTQFWKKKMLLIVVQIIISPTISFVTSHWC